MNEISKLFLDQYILKNIKYPPILGDPAELINIKKLELTLGVSLPSEISNIYLIYDGIGFRDLHQKRYWHFHPTHEVKDFMAEIRCFFSQTHPLEAEQFFPFFDWGSGDAIGYLMGDDGWQSGIFEFDHENYEFDSEQPASDFLIKCGETMADFLVE